MSVEKKNNGNEETLFAKFQGMLVGALGSLDASELEDMILSREMPKIIDLVDLVPGYLNGIKDVLYKKREDITDTMSVDNVIRGLVIIERPDLAKIIASEKGAEWTESLIKLIGFVLENIHLSSIEIKRKMIRKIREKKLARQKIEEEKRLEEMRLLAEEEAARLVAERAKEEAIKRATIENTVINNSEAPVQKESVPQDDDDDIPEDVKEKLRKINAFKNNQK